MTTTRRIAVLAGPVIAQIAAGETVERPVSVLKELVENSLDAGATEIRVDITGSVDRSLRVSDNGSGMEASDVPLAFLRHATSKLTSADDLHRITTLGFRGEALPSIAQVAHVTLATRTPDADSGVEVRVDGGEIVGMRPVARAPGTSVLVEDLFYNVPARRKFLKAKETEIRLATRLLSSYALAHPGVRFGLTLDGRTVLNLPATDSLEARLIALYGASIAKQLVPVQSEGGDVELKGVLGVPEAARASREHQYLFVNDRPVQHALLTYIVRRSYGTMIPEGRHPFFVLSLRVTPEQVDVNVHPTKREVRFAREGDVAAAAARAIDEALRTLVHTFELVPGALPEGPAAPQDFGGAGWVSDAGRTPRLTVLGPESLPPSERQISMAHVLLRPSTPPEPTSPEEHRAPSQQPVEERAPRDSPFWQLHGTWVFAPIKSGFIIVDQHAAHERIAYEQVRARLRGRPASSQELLFPDVLDLTASEYNTLLTVLAALEKLGFDIRAMSGNSIVVRGIPADLKTWNGGMFLRDLLADTEEYETTEPALYDALSASYACHSVVRANQRLTAEEMGALIDALFQSERPEACPHGRPTFVRVGLDELEKRFGRR
jgi:DNA mismatch repair protein MutL